VPSGRGRASSPSTRPSRFPTHRSQTALAFGARIGVRMMRVPLLVAPRRTDRRTWNPGRESGASPFALRLGGPWRGSGLDWSPTESGFAVTPSRRTLLVPRSIHTTTYRVFSRIVSTLRKSAGCPSPGSGGTRSRWGLARGRTQPRTPEQGGDGGGRDPHPEFQKPSPEPQVAPPRVLPSHAEDQLASLGIQSRTPRRTMGPGLLPHDESAVPPEQGPGPHQEGSPPLPRGDPAGCGQEGSVCSSEDRALDLAAEHGHLVAEDQDLQVPVGFVRPP